MWSEDGHGEHEILSKKCNYDTREVECAYETVNMNEDNLGE